MKNVREINWEEVESKVGAVCAKFKNIKGDYLDDLAQELRIHAYYKSDNYYDLYRRAIDFWRSMQIHVYPEVPYFDMELLSDVHEDKDETVTYHELLEKIYKELARDCYTKAECRKVEIIKKILELITDDIDNGRDENKFNPSNSLDYFGGKISITYVSERTATPYKHVQEALNFLQTLIRELEESGRIELSPMFQERKYD